MEAREPFARNPAEKTWETFLRMENGNDSLYKRRVVPMFVIKIAYTYVCLYYTIPPTFVFYFLIPLRSYKYATNINAPFHLFSCEEMQALFYPEPHMYSSCL